MGIMADQPPAVAAVGYHRFGTAVDDGPPQLIDVVAAVGYDAGRGSGRRQELARDADVGSVTGRQAERERPPEEGRGERWIFVVCPPRETLIAWSLPLFSAARRSPPTPCLPATTAPASPSPPFCPPTRPKNKRGGCESRG